jgi:hypothetical protein
VAEAALRRCDICGSVDDLPHHVIGSWVDEGRSAHFACCAAAGCPDGSCSVALASEGKLTLGAST